MCKVVWNKSKSIWQAVSELAQSESQSSSAGSQVATSPSGVIAGTLLLLVLPFSTLTQAALPSGGQLAAGNGSINTSGNTLTVQQSSQNMAINWQNFSVAEGHTVNFVQPNSQAAALNRVTGNQVSDIRGAINANGRVFLVNPNGIMFSNTARVDAGSLVASTLDISTEDFMAGNYRFAGDSSNAIINQGNITTPEGGVVAMIATRIINSGNITTPEGGALMGAGSKVVLDLGGPLSIEVEEAQLETYIEQDGAIRADSGLVYLTAKAANELTASVINHTGITQAQTLAAGEDGRIMLMGDMHSGQVQVAGILDASAPTAGNGGFIETSAAKVAIDEAQVTTHSENGQTGEWLIDPNDYTIAATGGDITGLTLGGLLADNNITIQSVTGTNDTENLYATASGNGDIFVNDEVTWTSGNTLTLNAIRNIEINKTIDASGGSGGKLVLEYGQGAFASNNTATYSVNAPVNLQAGQNFSTKLGSDGSIIDYTVVNDQASLQAMNNNKSGNYALGFDLTLTGEWTPIGDLNGMFKGRFDGLGHSLFNLKINQEATNDIGFFGATYNNSIVQNINLIDANISGNNNVGGLIGRAQGTFIANTSTSGLISATEHNSGGLIGFITGTGAVIKNSNSSSTVEGKNKVGGLVGYLFRRTIESSYATGTINGENEVGGLVGNSQQASIINSYSINNIISGHESVGGLVGNADAGSITNSYAVTQSITSNLDTSMGGLVGNSSGANITHSYWDTTTSGLTTSAGGEGKTSEQMRNATTYKDWDASTWTFLGGRGVDVAGYEVTELRPYLTQVTHENHQDTGTTYLLFSGGMGVEGNAYTIANWNQLQNINHNSNVLTGGYHFTLTNGLDATNTGYNEQASATANSNAGWNPIGNNTNKFTGTFDGNNHTISDLVINRSSSNYVGLFGYTKDATIKNLGVTDADITGGGYVGVLAGQTDASTLQNLHSSGTVTGKLRTGGLVGFANSASSITHSYSSSAVTGTTAVGGLVGSSGNDGYGGSTLSDVYATGEVKGDKYAGGLVGDNSGSVEKAYATGKITANSQVGGLAGVSNWGSIKYSFYATTDADGNAINQTNDSGKGEGKTLTELQSLATFNDGSAGWSIAEDPDLEIGSPVLAWTQGNSSTVWVIGTKTSSSGSGDTGTGGDTDTGGDTGGDGDPGTGGDAGTGDTTSPGHSNDGGTKPTLGQQQVAVISKEAASPTTGTIPPAVFTSFVASNGLSNSGASTGTQQLSGGMEVVEVSDADFNSGTSALGMGPQRLFVVEGGIRMVAGMTAQEEQE
ncbi:MAG: GLUG motif-containing protein [Marinospirillum sp.]|nr:GLUG motif-containing protein [Marinospirillum sp.]